MNGNDEEKNIETNIDRLRKRLYKKEESFGVRAKRRELQKREQDVPSYWKSQIDIKNPIIKRPRFSFLKSIIVLTVILFLGSVGYVAYLLWGGGLVSVSQKNIHLDIKNPVSVEGGKIIEMRMTVKNGNNSALELAELIIEYPQGVVSPEDSETMKSKERFSLGNINPKEETSKTISFTLLGEENEEKKFTVTLEYRLKDSNAIYYKTSESIIKIFKAPIGISINMPKEIRSNEGIIMNIEAVSNSEVSLHNLVLKMEYPSGFQFLKAKPEPIENKNEWIIGDLNPTQKRNIEIQGIIEGQDMSEKAVHVKIGRDENSQIISYGSATETITVRRPLIDLRLFVNGQDIEDNVIKAGENIRGTISWKNNLSSKIRNAVIEVKAVGETVDKRTVSVREGSYRSFDDTMVWNSSTLNNLTLILPGQEGNASFNFFVVNPIPVNSSKDKNFIIKISGKITGIVVSEDRGDIEMSNDFEKEVKISSKIQLTNRILFSTGDFVNSGPLPPKVGAETTYTVVWSITNAYNNASNVVVRSFLPSYVRFLKNISPQDSDITFDERTGEIVWNAGLVQAGTGILRQAREVSFQIGFTPNLSQVGSFPNLISDTKLDGHDDFTNVSLNDSKSSLNTRSVSDPQFVGESMARVIE